jgi:hypothetical protein
VTEETAEETIRAAFKESLHADDSISVIMTRERAEGLSTKSQVFIKFLLLQRHTLVQIFIRGNVVDSQKQ